jgi:hypothetical protein
MALRRNNVNCRVDYILRVDELSTNLFSHFRIVRLCQWTTFGQTYVLVKLKVLLPRDGMTCHRGHDRAD